MWLLVSWAHCSSTVKSSLADSDHLHDWLKKLTLLVPEVSRPPFNIEHMILEGYWILLGSVSRVHFSPDLSLLT